MTIKIYILLIAFGFFLIPNAIFACNSHSNIEMSKHHNKNGCNKEDISKISKHSCCDKKTSPNKSDSGCNGECGHNNCTISLVNVGLLSPYFNGFSFDNDYSFSDKIKFSYLKTNISSGFYSVWLIPKIG